MHVRSCISCPTLYSTNSCAVHQPRPAYFSLQQAAILGRFDSTKNGNKQMRPNVLQSLILTYQAESG
jgi:Fe-S-cluster containining protein